MVGTESRHKQSRRTTIHWGLGSCCLEDRQGMLGVGWRITSP